MPIINVIIQNDKVHLIPVTENDRELYRCIYSDKNLMRYVVKPLTDEEADKSFALVLKKMQGAKPQLRIFKIISPPICKTAGLIGLRWNQQNRNHAEIGVIILAEYQRKGLAHIAKSLLMQTAFCQWNLDKIIAECDKDNLAANRANKKLGFRQTSVFTDNNKMKVRWEMDKNNIGCKCI